MIEIQIGARPTQSSTVKERIIVLTNLSTSVLGVNTYHELRFGLDNGFSTELEFYAYEDIRFPEMRLLLVKANVDNQGFTLYVDQATTTHINPTFANFVNSNPDFTLLGYDSTSIVGAAPIIFGQGVLTGVFNCVNWELPLNVTGNRYYYYGRNVANCIQTYYPVIIPSGVLFHPEPQFYPPDSVSCNNGGNIYSTIWTPCGLINSNDNDTITNSLIQLGDNTVRDIHSYVKYDLVYTAKRSNSNPNERFSIAFSGTTPNIDLSHRGNVISGLNSELSYYYDQVEQVFNAEHIKGLNEVNDSQSNVFGMNIVRSYNEQIDSTYSGMYIRSLRENNYHDSMQFQTSAVNTGNMRSTAVFVAQDSTNGSNAYYGGIYSSILIDKDILIDNFIATMDYTSYSLDDLITQYETDLNNYYDLWSCAKPIVETYNIAANKYVQGTICLDSSGTPITDCVCKTEYNNALETITSTSSCVYNLIVAYGNLLNDYQAIISLGGSVEPPVDYTNPDWNDYNKYVHYGMPDMPNDMHIGIVDSDSNEPDYVVNTLPTNPVNWAYYFVANSDGTVSVQEYNGTNWNILDTTTIPNMSIVLSGSERKYYCYYNGEFITNVPWFSRDPYDYVTTVSTVGGAYGQTVGVNKNNSPNRRTVVINGREYIIWTDINNDVWVQYDDTNGTKVFRLQDNIDIIGEDL